MENTIENRHRFFSLYFGQDVYMFNDAHPCINPMTYWNIIENETEENDFLLLKPLSSISDEDAIEIRKLNGNITANNKLVGHTLVHWLYKEGTSRDIPFEAVDYLRSKGYALPWMGLSVETLVEYGWVKLKTE